MIKICKNEDLCCSKLLKLLDDAEMDFIYSKVYRSFMYRTIVFCPLCGRELPPDLTNFYNETLEKEANIKISEWSRAERENRIPKEFFSDEWWLKRQHYPNFPTKNLTHNEQLKQVLHDLNFGDEAKRKAKYKKLLNEEKATKKKLGAICCTNLWFNIYNEHRCTEHQNNECSRSLIEYEPEKRRFSLKSIANAELYFPAWKKKKRFLFFQFYFCPECGKELPKSLASMWFKIVTTEFGVTDIFNQKQLAKKLSPEFLTEEWWIKRGL